MAEGGFRGAARCCGSGLSFWERLGCEGPWLRGPEGPLPLACPRAGARPARPARALPPAPAGPAHNEGIILNHHACILGTI